MLCDIKALKFHIKQNKSNWLLKWLNQSIEWTSNYCPLFHVVFMIIVEIYGYIYHEVWHIWVSYLFQKIQLQESYVSNIFKIINYKWQTVIGEQKNNFSDKLKLKFYYWYKKNNFSGKLKLKLILICHLIFIMKMLLIIWDEYQKFLVRFILITREI